MKFKNAYIKNPIEKKHVPIKTEDAQMPAIK